MRLFLAALAGLLLAVGAAHAADLVLRIDGVRSNVGDLYVALFDSAKNWPDGDRAEHQIKVKAAAGTVVTVISGLSPGTYAIGGFHDENGNGELDKNFIGVPTEGFFVSTVSGMILSTPDFADVAFALPPEGATVTLRMRYY